MADFTNKTDAAPDDWRQQAEALRDQEKWDDLISLSPSVIPTLKTDDEKAFAYFVRGYAYGQKGDYDLAIADYNQAIKLKSDNATAYNNRGNIYNKKGEYDLAIADSNKAIELNPDYAEAYNNRGGAYNEKGEYDLAIADFNKAIELQPDFAAAYNNRGYAYDQKKEYDLAIADSNKAIELNPDYAVAYNNRGSTYNKKGEHDRAIADFNKAIELKPDYAMAYNNRGHVYAAKDEHDKALADWEKAIKLAPHQNPAMVDNLLGGIKATTMIRQRVVGELKFMEGFERREDEHRKAKILMGWLTAILLFLLFAYYIVAFGALAYRFEILPITFGEHFAFYAFAFYPTDPPEASKVLPWIPVILLTSSPLVWAVRLCNRQYTREFVLCENAHMNKTMTILTRIKPEHSLQGKLLDKLLDHHTLRGSPQLIIDLENKPKTDDSIIRQMLNLFRRGSDKQGGNS